MFASVSMRLDHRFTGRRASAFVDGELDPRSMARVERHLQVCPLCADLIRTLRATVAGLRGLRTDAAASADGQPELVRSILDGLAEDPGWSDPPLRPPDG